MILDLNCDLGEGIGADAEVIPLITSANVSCGWHAGTPEDILNTLKLCRQHNVVVGAHPGHADREHFGRRELLIPSRDVLEQTFEQIQQLRVWGKLLGVEVRYVKPHGALYHQAHGDDQYAEAVICAAAMAGLPVVGMPGSRLQERAKGRVRFVAEGFADRRYLPDGRLVPRGQPGASIETPEEAVSQVLNLLTHGVIDTVCVHGDHPQAVEFARAVRTELVRQNVELKSFV
ncbi:5-oxoprolinase subunit PxpA [Zavarzinella formosa]|uniref:5-oxoprolinase subunit PxpA n=1 Tax=Zavarzinella formosa TaxID=360055 RepID=UPI0002F0E78D|nr:5-oxoprolinase subunit PxpA [Zavarzinella formosa]